MEKAPLPENEIERLKRLRAYDILDTAPEEEYDRIVELACHIAKTPIALISLIDEKRQWFKARRGMSGESSSRDISFCSHVVADGEPLEVRNAGEDVRFCDNPFVDGREHEISYYRGTPLVADDGSALGSLCVIDTQPGTLDDEQKRMLDHLAATVVELFESRRTARRLAQSERLVRRLYQVSNVGRVPEEHELVEFVGIGCEHFGFEIGLLCKFDGSDHQIRALISPDDRGYLADDFIFSDDSVAVRVAGSDGPFVARSLSDEERESVPPEEESWRSVASCPLFDEGEYSGSITFASRTPMEREFGPSDLEQLRLLGVWLGSELKRRAFERERTRLVGELTIKVQELETLHGLLPICSYCKQVRDEDGSWQQIEHFVAARSGADFSHSICPGCYDHNITPDVG